MLHFHRDDIKSSIHTHTDTHTHTHTHTDRCQNYSGNLPTGGLGHNELWDSKSGHYLTCPLLFQVFMQILPSASQHIHVICKIIFQTVNCLIILLSAVSVVHQICRLASTSQKYEPAFFSAWDSLCSDLSTAYNLLSYEFLLKCHLIREQFLQTALCKLTISFSQRLQFPCPAFFSFITLFTTREVFVH